MATIDEYVIWEPEIVGEKEQADGGSRPSPARPISEQIDTIRISRKAVLADLVKSLGGKAPTYGVRRTSAGFDGHVRAKVPEIRGSPKLREMYGHSNASFSTKERAEEQAAEGFIRSLKRNFHFEVDEINWLEKNQYDARVEMEKLRQENRDLKDTVDELTHGWSTTLCLLDYVHGMASNARASAVDALNHSYGLDPRGRMEYVLKKVAGVEEYIGKTILQGSTGFNRAARMEE